MSEAEHEAAVTEPVIIDNPAESRFELYVGGERAGLVVYELAGHQDGQQEGGAQVSVLHSEIEHRFQRVGLRFRLPSLVNRQ
jgi:hypothetical protein